MGLLTGETLGPVVVAVAIFLLLLRSRFGDVFSLQLAWTPVVVINGLAAMREALVDQSEDTADRPPMPVFEHLGFGPHAQGKRRREGLRPSGDLARSDPRPAGPSGGRAVSNRRLMR
ncbi:hypothetical protein HPG69_018710 [Diceros bicornis minor]|uniref:Uncharacterized protein n=1 Tax=Diceros bicornis minor TaxID=77932 RepID=A0A7J7EEI7_DICBM|nr:hypothetical protein HPG69_018710 [Diceros bicornis minor]